MAASPGARWRPQKFTTHPRLQWVSAVQAGLYSSRSARLGATTLPAAPTASAELSTPFMLTAQPTSSATAVKTDRLGSRQTTIPILRAGSLCRSMRAALPAQSLAPRAHLEAEDPSRQFRAALPLCLLRDAQSERQPAATLRLPGHPASIQPQSRWCPR